MCSFFSCCCVPIVWMNIFIYWFHYFQANVDFYLLAETLKEYIGLIGAVKVRTIFFCQPVSFLMLGWNKMWNCLKMKFLLQRNEKLCNNNEFCNSNKLFLFFIGCICPERKSLADLAKCANDFEQEAWNTGQIWIVWKNW